MHFEAAFAAFNHLLARPDLKIIADGCDFVPDPSVGNFLYKHGRLRLSPAALSHEAGAVRLRHALELALLRAAGAPPALAGLGAARVAAHFSAFERTAHTSEPPPPPVWMVALSADEPPSAEVLAALWRGLAAHQPDADSALPADVPRRLADLWALLAPVETLLQSGGDGRLEIDPETGLNAYGSSHRPRPWAVTFASSTASSCSERGFAAAEHARRRVLATALQQSAASAQADAARRAKDGIAGYYGLKAGTEIVLAASGTDSELFALALAQLHRSGKPIVNLLMAPEETGSGVPLAASGRHFAGDTAGRARVEKGGLIDGFPESTRIEAVAVRDATGAVRPLAEIDAEVTDKAAAAIGRGARVVLHLLDLSKTGLLAPGLDALRRLQARYPDDVDVVVDACQARLEAARVRAYLDFGWIVLITGSKFFTGPPFAGALLVPRPIAARLDQPLPRGLSDYTGRLQWPASSVALPDRPNLGLGLRWEATLAEMRAFAAVPPAWRRHVLSRFAEAVQALVAASDDLRALPVPRIDRSACPEAWDEIPTIFGFAVLAPAGEDGKRRPMQPGDARLVYHWLNSDLCAALPRADPAVAALRCHIGQPAPVALPDCGVVGVLRISAGSRLVSGEPSHAGLDGERRLQREIDDVARIVAKIGIIVEYWNVLRQAEVRPTFC